MRLCISSSALLVALVRYPSVDSFVIVPSTSHHRGISSSSSSTQAQSSPSALFYERGDKVGNNLGGGTQFVSPVLQIVYPKLLEWKQEYGHPNIPLGSPEGRHCATLRRLHIQKKLTDEEVEWLDELGFVFHSLEDVYHDVDFDTLFQRLMDYEARHPESNFQVPKKCAEDPELGAWVTGIRRLGTEKVDPKHAQKLNEVNFVWVSKRKCGSKFMLQYNELLKQVEGMPKDEAIESLLADQKVKDMIQAQKNLQARGKMSETRLNYMNHLFGESWNTLV